ncbi:cyclase family protein [Streptacidiphilus rugosus]|uniref:cyclase family protein n=1 Tax=Streptacidiphilus rugosus TaxID=405783 RepID=UPI0005690A77|nr:cyclase family protein [Streptacidiphilus rugosus]
MAQPADEAVHGQELRDCAAHQGSPLRPGDTVLVRTGYPARVHGVGPWDPDRQSAGLQPNAMPVLDGTRARALGSDGDSDTRPGLVPGIACPVRVRRYLVLLRTWLPPRWRLGMTVRFTCWDVITRAVRRSRAC